MRHIGGPHRLSLYLKPQGRRRWPAWTHVSFVIASGEQYGSKMAHHVTLPCAFAPRSSSGATWDGRFRAGSSYCAAFMAAVDAMRSVALRMSAIFQKIRTAGGPCRLPATEPQNCQQIEVRLPPSRLRWRPGGSQSWRGCSRAAAQAAALFFNGEHFHALPTGGTPKRRHC